MRLFLRGLAGVRLQLAGNGLDVAAGILNIGQGAGDGVVGRAHDVLHKLAGGKTDFAGPFVAVAFLSILRILFQFALFQK